MFNNDGGFFSVLFHEHVCFIYALTNIASHRGRH